MAVNLITDKQKRQIEQDMSTATALSIKKFLETATGLTLRSVQTEITQEREGFLEFTSSAGGAVPFRTFGKPANTKLPVVKNGERFELVPRLKDWKRIRNFSGNDYLLARSIARKALAPIDFGEEALKQFNKIRRNEGLIDTFTADIANDLEKEFEDDFK